MRFGFIDRRGAAERSEIVAHADKRLVAVILSALGAEVAVAILGAGRDAIGNRIFEAAANLQAVEVVRRANRTTCRRER